MTNPRRAASILRATAAVVLLTAPTSFLTACSGSSEARRVSKDDVEIALYVAVQADDSRIVTSGAKNHAPLDQLYDIACQKTPFDTWACTVQLPGESPVICTIDKVSAGDEIEIDGRVHCKY